MSRRATKSPYSSKTLICVCGLGKRASINANRVRVSCGDSAPPSTSGNTRRSRSRPGEPGCSEMTASMSTILMSVAFVSASSRWIACSREAVRRPMSNAVRAGVVTGIPSSVRISCAANVSVCYHDLRRRLSVVVRQFDRSAHPPISPRATLPPNRRRRLLAAATTATPRVPAGSRSSRCPPGYRRPDRPARIGIASRARKQTSRPKLQRRETASPIPAWADAATGHRQQRRV